MSKDYPCVHYDEGKCKEFSDDKVTSYCVLGPCGAQVLSNADRIRAMSDIEIAKLFVQAVADGCPPQMDWDCAKDADGWEACDACWCKWLRQPAEEVQGDG